MLKNFCIFCVGLILSAPLFAQKTNGGNETFKKSAVVKAYRGYIKEKNYAKARQEVEEAIKKYEEAAIDVVLYKYDIDALNELIGLENRKIYLNANPDTTAFFNYMYDLYVAGLTCDSLEQTEMKALKAEGKKPKPKLRTEVGQTLLPYRKNLLSAGKYYYRKKDYTNAYKFINMYAQTKSADVFIDMKGNSIVADPDDLQEVSVLAVLSAYGSSNYRGVISYLSESLNDKDLDPKLLEIGSKSVAELGDTTEMLALLEQGFKAYPETEYFFITLTKYYNDEGEFAKALEKAIKMTELYPDKRDYWFMAGKEQVLLEKYTEALTSFEKCIEIKADDAESFSAMGNIYLHDAHAAYAQFNVPLSDPSYAKKKTSINELYKKACGAFEQAKKFEENNPTLWLDGLREAYFKLNNGKGLKTLEKYR